MTTTKIPWGDGELKALAKDPTSKIVLKQERISLPLQPFHLKDLKSAIRNILDNNIDSYHKMLKGVLLSYKHLKILQNLASLESEQSDVIIDIQANFFVFTPEIGCVLKGEVNKTSKDHVGVLLYHRFNVVCPRPHKYNNSTGWLGDNVQINQEVTFKLKEMDFNSRLPYFKGKLISSGAIATAPNEEKIDEKIKKKLKKQEIKEKSVILDAVPAVFPKKSKKRKLTDTEATPGTKSKEMEEYVMDSGSFTQPEKKKQKKPKMAEILNSAEKSKSKKGEDKIKTGLFEKKNSEVCVLSSSDFSPPNAESTHIEFDTSTRRLSLGFNVDKKKTDKPMVLPAKEIISQDIHGSPDKKKKLDLNDTNSPSKSKKKKLTSEDIDMSGLKKLGEIKDPEAEINAKKKKKKKTGDKSESGFASQEPESDSTVGLSFEKKKKKNKKDKSSQGNSSVFDNFSLPAPVAPKSPPYTFSPDLFSSPSKVVASEKTNALIPSTQASKKLKRNLSLPKKSKEESQILSRAIDSNHDSEDGDDIPCGQRTISSPKSTARIESPGLEQYIANSRFLNTETGCRRSSGILPLKFGEYRGFVPPPPESPVKSETITKKTPKLSLPASKLKSPQKIVINDKPRDNLDSDSDDGTRSSFLAKKNSPVKKENITIAGGNISSSDSDDSLKRKPVVNKFFQSMGVMRSPLKHVTQISKPQEESSDGEDSDIADMIAASRRISETQNKPKETKATKPTKNKVQATKKPIDSKQQTEADDSDSGPNDRNTISIIEDIRKKKLTSSKSISATQPKKSSKKTALQLPAITNLQVVPEASSKEAENNAANKKGKKSKVSDVKSDEINKKLNPQEASVSKETKKSGKGKTAIRKTAPKEKKKASLDDDINDVMKRLLTQAKKEIGL